MRTSCTNIYQIARKSAGFTQEQAAEMLHVSVRSLADYERGRTVPGDGHEAERWKRVVKEINEMAGAALAVVFSQKERAHA